MQIILKLITSKNNLHFFMNKDYDIHIEIKDNNIGFSLKILFLKLMKYGININSQPKHFPPKDPHLAAKFTIAAIQLGNKLTFGRECLKCLWSEEKDISDINVIEQICKNLNVDFKKVKEMADSDEIKTIYNKNSINFIVSC